MVVGERNVPKVKFRHQSRLSSQTEFHRIKISSRGTDWLSPLNYQFSSATERHTVKRSSVGHNAEIEVDTIKTIGFQKFI